MPHEAGEDYEAILEWVDENFNLIVTGDLPFDFGNYEAQRAADKRLVELLGQAGASSDVIHAVDNMPPTPFPRGEEPAFTAQESKSVFGQVYDALKSFGEKIVSGLRSLFGGG